MAVLFAVVARGSTVLAKHACFSGNFLEVTEQILAKIPSENNRLTYSHGSYLFHYICHERIVSNIYSCKLKNHILSNVKKKRFQTTYGSRAQTALPYAMNSEFSSTLAAQMIKHHSPVTGKPERNTAITAGSQCVCVYPLILCRRAIPLHFNQTADVAKYIQNVSRQVTFIYMELYTIQIVSKQASQ
uniref:AP-3 complex subunit delta-1 n=1 Tax=Sinocyclocheilus grahami TaxID=75366 RepID=A0A672KZ55_SINGR